MTAEGEQSLEGQEPSGSPGAEDPTSEGSGGPDQPTVPDLGKAPVPTSIDVEAIFPEVRRLKAAGAALFLVAGLSAVMPLLTLTDSLQTPLTLLALTMAAAGVTVGIAGLASPVFRRWASLSAPILLLVGAAAGSPGASLATIPPAEIAWALLFAGSWLLSLEHLLAVMRFVELGAYVTRQRLSSFQLHNVVNHFQLYGVGLVAIILGVTAIVVVGVPWVFAKGASGTFSRSVELSSVIGIGIASAVVFTLAGLILISVRSVMPQRVEVTSVAYSRERMEDLLRGSRVMANMEGQGDGVEARGGIGEEGLHDRV